VLGNRVARPCNRCRYLASPIITESEGEPRSFGEASRSRCGIRLPRSLLA
jgi:hypothetical protein